MQLDKKNFSVDETLREIHRNRQVPEMSRIWKSNVMADIERAVFDSPFAALFNLPAPVAAGFAAASVVMIIMAVQVITGLGTEFNDFSMLQAYSLSPQYW